MRIDLFSSTASEIANEKDAKQVGAQNAAGPGQRVSAEDRTTLTSDTTSVGTLVSAALSSPEIRQDNVASFACGREQRAIPTRPGKDRRVHHR